MVKLTIWYDGSCPLCMREIGLMQRLDKRKVIEFVDAANPNITCPIDRAELLARFHALEDGNLISGAAAFAAMWRAIPVLRPIGLLAKNALILRLLEFLYIRFLRLRPLLQRALLAADKT